MKTVIDLLRVLRVRLTPTLGGDLAQADAETVIENTLHISKAQLYTESLREVSDVHLELIEPIINRRLSGEPLQYILGRAYFYDREFIVNPDVLIPRPDTEILVDAVINNEKNAPAHFIDMGTGSGIIAAVLTAHRPVWTAVATDISFGALRTAARNIWGGNECQYGDAYTCGDTCQQRSVYPGTNECRHKKKKAGDGRHQLKNVHLLCCDMFDALKPKKQFDFIVSNPPYISSVQMFGLDRSVINHEPHKALHGGDDGLNFYRMISRQAKMYLKDRGRVYLEIGYDQGESVPKVFGEDGWGDVAVIKDLGGRDRVVIINK